jgi:tRNA uridine 5-carbamoylmethylation protein Kti12
MLFIPFRLIFLFLFLILMMGNASGQCISFARNIAKPLLEDFIHDGNYNATYMEEGESAELYKTFFQDEEYRLVVSAVESLPQIHVRLLDDQRNVIFDNANHNFAQVWDFKAETTGTLIVYLKIPDSEDAAQITGGCIAILFGVQATGRRH